MLQSALILIAAAHVAVCGPQFVSMKDGKIGVNFGGYHAEAGLGGLLTGNAAHGGLTASAGTPFGQNARAGLGGIVNGRPAGTAFAGATAGGNVGASAGLGGVVGGETDSGIGAEAHAGGASHSVISQGGGGFQIRKTIGLPPPPAVEFQGNFHSTNNAAASANVDFAAESDVVQKIKPQKKVIHEAAPTNPLLVEERFEVPAHLEVVAEAAPEVETTHHIETVQQVRPVQTEVVASAGGNAASNFQKEFGFNFQFGGGGESHIPETYVVEENVPVQTPAPQVVVEKRIEVPNVETNRHVVVEKKFETPKLEVETVQYAAPAKKPTYFATAVEQQPSFNFQKQFDFNIALGGGANKPQQETYVIEESIPVQTPPPRVVVEKRIEVPKVETVQRVETVQEVVPLKHKTVYTSAPVEQPAWGFQKQFDFNFGLGGGGYGQVPYQPAPVYNPPTYFYRKHHHVRPAQRRVYQYETEVVPVVQKRKQVVVQSAPAPAPAAGYGGFAAQGRVDGGFFDSIFNIPIQTLKAVNGLLNTKAQAGGGIQFQKSAGFQLG